jgi:multidrug resistance efflux pump
MATTAFARTFARLLSDRGGLTRTVLAMGLLVLGGWCFWAARAHVTLYEVSSDARVELDAATYPIQSPLLGRVVQVHLRVGQPVQRGDILVEIDAAPEQLHIRQENIHAQGLELEVARLRSQVAAEESARAEERRAAHLSLEEAHARVREAEVASKYADAELSREQKMQQAGLIPPCDLERADAEAHRLRAAFETLETAARRQPQEQATRDRERDMGIQRLYSEIAALEDQRNTVSAGVQGLKYEVERRQIRAPIDRRIGECMTLRPGSVVEEAESLASIVPSGELRVVAQFPAEAALGRIQPGQPATLRLDGYPLGRIRFGLHGCAHGPGDPRREGAGRVGDQSRCKLSRAARPWNAGNNRGRRRACNSAGAGVAHHRPVDDEAPMKRFLVPEVIQSSVMDCGPASLKALFGGFGLYLSSGSAWIA